MRVDLCVCSASNSTAGFIGKFPRTIQYNEVYARLSVRTIKSELALDVGHSQTWLCAKQRRRLSRSRREKHER